MHLVNALWESLVFIAPGYVLVRALPKHTGGPAVELALTLAASTLVWGALGVVYWQTHWPPSILRIGVVLLCAPAAWFAYRKQRWARPTIYLLGPSVAAIALTAFVLANHLPEEPTENTDFGNLMTVRMHAYSTNDHLLQYTISQNFVGHVDIETNFRPGGQGLWSAGDRPMLVGFLDATLSTADGTHGLVPYIARIYMIAGLLPLFLAALLRTNAGTVPTLYLFAVAVQPFWVSNSLYTWPKVSGLVYALAAGVVLQATIAQRLSVVVGAIAAGLLFAFGVLNHSMTVFATLAVLLWFALEATPTQRQSLRRAYLPIGLFCGALLMPLLVHATYLKLYTLQTHLLERVNFCAEGSYVTPSPVVSLLTACRGYWARRGLIGILDDRYNSIRAVFWSNYKILRPIFLASTTFGNLWDIDRLFPGFASGLVWAPLALPLLALQRFRRTVSDSATLTNGGPLILVGSLIALGFGMMCALHGEVVAHSLPYVASAFIQLGFLLVVGAYSERWGIGVAAGLLVASLAIDVAVLGPELRSPRYLIVALLVAWVGWLGIHRLNPPRTNA